MEFGRFGGFLVMQLCKPSSEISNKGVYFMSGSCVWILLR